MRKQTEERLADLEEAYFSKKERERMGDYYADKYNDNVLREMNKVRKTQGREKFDLTGKHVSFKDTGKKTRSRSRGVVGSMSRS